MKIAILGYSGSGKSTLCRCFAELHGLPALHLDTVQYLPDWKIRPLEEKIAIVSEFMDHAPNGWVIDGNYSHLLLDRRLEEADLIVMLLFGRFTCLSRVLKRYKTFRTKTRPDMADGCSEKVDADFIKWILWKGRTRKKRAWYKSIREKYPEKITVLRNQRQLDAYYASLERVKS